ncbi:TIM-barrel domain-containing protein [Flexivirga sp. B27]
MINHAVRRLVAVLGAALLALTGLAALTPSAATAAAPAAAPAEGGHLADITAVEQHGDHYVFTAGEAKLRVTAVDDDLLRVEVAPDGKFTDPANDDPEDPKAPDADIVVKTDYGTTTSKLATTNAAYTISTADAQLTVTKSPATLTMARSNGTVLWRETAPLSWNDDGTTQHLAQGATEQYFGGGMQNGRFSHRGQKLSISKDGWDEGGQPNSVPFYISSTGYGVLRDTFAPGSYDFGSGDSGAVSTTHTEQRFDAYYFIGDAKQVIDGYTELTGRPLALPMYALELGDADCYLHNANRGERHTLADSTAVADGYKKHKLPLGWMLVNDGYGCEYEDLAETGDMLHQHGSELGLWTQRDLTEQKSEVAAGVRVRKTDVAWVGPGYRFGLDACEKARDGIEDNSTDRATVLTIEGWAGTQRCGAMWSGDQSGSWDYIKWQIPTYAGSTMSGQPVTTGDIDGIFGGSAKTYVRDLQWKMMLPMTYAMSGWANEDKQPWTYGEPYTSINKKYLMLHERLLPYFYTHTMNATKNGVGPTRPLYLDYPNDPNTWGEKAKYEFLAGDDFLVAPVYSDTSVRDGIYLPEGRWVDYWTGRIYQGGQTINGYKAPLDTLPMFVKAGAIVPQFPKGTLDWKAGKQAGQLDLDVYPSGHTSFTNYEDDGRSQSKASAQQRFDVAAPRTGSGPVTVRLSALAGSYAGKPTQRHYRLTVHTDKAAGSISVAGHKVPKRSSQQAVDAADSGWFYDSSTGVIHVKTTSLPTSQAATVRINGAGAVGGSHPDDRNVSLDVQAESISVAGKDSKVTAKFTNDTRTSVAVRDTSITPPKGWTVQADGPTTTDELADGATFTATYTLTPPASVEPGTVDLTATATYRVHGTSHTVTDRTNTTVAYADTASAYNNVGTTASDDPAPGNLDGGGSSFLADKLAAEGASPGAKVSANGFDFTWPDAQPGTKDNIAGAGQTISVSGQGNALAFLGTGTSASAGGAATVYYTDGTSDSGTVGMPNWCCLAQDSYGAEVAIRTLGKNTPDGPAYPTTEYRVYTSTMQIDPDKQVAAVTLPSNSAFHVFDIAAGTDGQHWTATAN